ncbi:hypothetical protein DU508_12750 [Pedobacter chinensis]|uniref:Uncharacterized protein n=1 Tax=Pedobacter chinensis TaxID=2282421 RepID=A0A369PZ31_9SPHI|nr:hypothetical protein [Pedobacter chinensis]RDC56455.1 hypothetical protein DU508_12750 [Pedobacter chinensis]
MRDLKPVIGNKGMDKLMNAPNNNNCVVLIFDIYQEFCSTIAANPTTNATTGNLKDRLLAVNGTTTCNWVNVGSFDVLICSGGSGGNAGPVYIPHSGGGTTGGSNNAPSQQQVQDAIKNNPFAFLQGVPCDIIRKCLKQQSLLRISQLLINLIHL